MTIDKAIEILDDIVRCGDYEGDPYASAAVKLGIEALKYIREHPETWGVWNPDVLPGETEEGK